MPHGQGAREAGSWRGGGTAETTQPHEEGKVKEKRRTWGPKAMGKVGGDDSDRGLESLEGSLTLIW